MKYAFVTGITGQDGSYLTELLLEKGYMVYGLIRRVSNINTKRIDHLFDNSNLILNYGDVTDYVSVTNILLHIKQKCDPTTDILEVYNLGAMSHVKVSFECPMYSSDVNGKGVLCLLECIRNYKMMEYTRFYQASTSEMYGDVLETPQNENTPFNPQSPYAIAKLYGYYITKNYRESYGMFACNGILFNHESPRRGSTFVTKKITDAVTNIVNGTQEILTLGNLYSLRDWGHAKDYVYGMWLMMQAEKPDDYVLATQEQHSVKEFVEKAFGLKGIEIKWKNSGLEEEGYDAKTNIVRIKVSEKYFRPSEVETLLGDASKVKAMLGWEPKIGFDELVKEMVSC